MREDRPQAGEAGGTVCPTAVPEAGGTACPTSVSGRTGAAGLARLCVVLLAGATLHAQNRGQAEVALQGYYLGGDSQSLNTTTGAAFKFQDFFPRLGFLSGSFEGYGAQNRLQTGENFLELRGAPWMGHRWTVTGGDFRTPASLVEFPFYNIFTPEIAARGVRIQATHQDTQYTFFAGQETLSAGPRVPYRILAPQTVMGASAVRRIGKHLRIGGRFMQFSSSPRDMADNPNLFPAGRDIGLARTLSVQSLYTPVDRLKLYAEVSRPTAQGRSTVLSSITGVSWESKALTLRVNYALQGALYLPLIGYFTGDRRGPFAEMRLRPWKRLELYGSASQYRNNLENDPNVTALRSSSGSAGLTATLPWKFYANGQISTIGLSSQEPASAAIVSRNRQFSASLSRPIGHHSLQINWRDLNLAMSPVSQRQRATEIQDMYQFSHFFVGGAARWQQASGSEQRNSIYGRGSLQGNAGRFSAYANVEYGNDLVNRTVFATNTYSTTVIGVALRLFRDWNLQAETFRNRLAMDLNPESIFVLGGGGAAISQNLAALNQWSLYFRLTKQIRWGGGLPSESLDQFAASAVPLVGTVEGVVKARTLAGAAYAAGIPISLDGHHTVTTDSEGHYLFTAVPEGPHDVSLSATELPAEFDPGVPDKARLLVQPRRGARADFEVLPLSAIEGTVTGPEGATLEGILIRLIPGARYTSTASDGHFAFYNVREGDFNLVLDTSTLPENSKLLSEPSVPAGVRAGAPVPPAVFSCGIVSSQKTVRKVLDKK
ncbi:MAG: carboxypeptidase-like regulatory domain-containing protein [Acidobacteriia bacterium]|nr:carboxypeptidase-like regulatory domain-containing protein [Terriglobia bacterium]